MGVFAVFKDQDEANRAFTIEEFHLNLWCLPSLGLRSFMCDVGLLLTGDALPSSLRLWMPFETDSATDLFDVIQNPTVAEMVFSSEITIHTAGTDAAKLTSEGIRDRTLCRATTAPPERVEGVDGIWASTLTFDPSNHKTIYLRVRFRLHDLGSAWHWRREGGLIRRHGALVDLRFNDLRNFAGDGARGVAANLVPIQRANVFVITPSDFHLIEASPEDKKSRVLEEDGWTTYLGRRFAAQIPFRRAPGLVHYWRSHRSGAAIDPEDEPTPSDERLTPITIHRPYAVFARLGPGRSLSNGELAGIAALMLLIGLPFVHLSHAGEEVRHWLSTVPGTMWDGAGDVKEVLAIVGIGSAVALWRFGQRLSRTLRRIRWSLEKAVY